MKTIEAIKTDFLEDLNQWQKIIGQFELDYLKKRPNTGEWSIGQVIDHFIMETNWYFSQARKALVDTQNMEKSKSATITVWLANNSFPDKRFKGPEDMKEPDQPISINELIEKVARLIKEIPILANEISITGSKGKSEHPGHQFLTALEWFQYAEMHCKHHFRQKERIEKLLGNDFRGQA